MSRRNSDRVNSGHKYEFNSFADVHICADCGTAEHSDGKFWLAGFWSNIEPPCLSEELQKWRLTANKPSGSGQVMKSGKYSKCNVLNCGNGDCVHDWIQHCCPFCGCQLVKVIPTGHVFCSNHFTVCDYETDIKELTEGNV